MLLLRIDDPCRSVEYCRNQSALLDGYRLQHSQHSHCIDSLRCFDLEIEISAFENPVRPSFPCGRRKCQGDRRSRFGQDTQDILSCVHRIIVRSRIYHRHRRVVPCRFLGIGHETVGGVLVDSFGRDTVLKSPPPLAYARAFQGVAPSPTLCSVVSDS